MRALVRLRANPAKIRVGIRAVSPDTWLVSVCCRENAQMVQRVTKAPKIGVLRAIIEAFDAKLPGVDLFCGSTYWHPWPEIAAAQGATVIRP